VAELASKRNVDVGVFDVILKICARWRPEQLSREQLAMRPASWQNSNSYLLGVGNDGSAIDVVRLLYKMLAFVPILVLHFSIPPGFNKHTNITITNFILFFYLSHILT
jgi:hypothetical protein